MRTLRLVLFSLVVSLSFVAYAACDYYTIDNTNGQRFSSPGQACNAYIAASYGGAPGVWGVVTSDGSGCEIWADPGGGKPAVLVSTKGISKLSDPNCNDQCKSKMGTEVTINWTVGYTRTPNIDTDANWKLIGPPNVVPPDGAICEAASTCKVLADYSTPKAYQSLAPTPQGTYRLSLDFTAMYTGDTCSPTALDNAGTNTKEPIPPCPGFVGEVNGVPGCYGTASNPSSADVSTPKPSPPEAGNPPAGNKPDSGEGSGSGGAGRTPSTGNGGPAGGPAGAAGSGTKPDGTTPKPPDGKEQAACGAPGQPKCGIDEGGTPSKFEGDKAALDGWKSAVEANRNTIKDADGSFFDSYSMFFAVPPIVPCEPIELPNDQLLTRQCDVVEGTRSVMSYIWALAAIWICLGWIREAI